MHDAFLRIIQERPHDDEARLIYADWLEDQDNPDDSARARYLRLECEQVKLAEGDPRRQVIEVQLREQARRLPIAWTTIVSKRLLENCQIPFSFRCPKRWDLLTPIPGEEKIRACPTCQKQVHYCSSITEAHLHAWNGDCVAIDARAEREPGDLALIQGEVIGLIGDFAAHDPVANEMPPPTVPRSWWDWLLGRF